MALPSYGNANAGTLSIRGLSTRAATELEFAPNALRLRRDGIEQGKKGRTKISQPVPYNRQTNFVDYALANPINPFNPEDLDDELDSIEQTLDGICDNLSQIQRDDGELANSSVGPEQLDASVLSLMASGINPRGDWVTATEYAVGDVVIEGVSLYWCLVAHTSGTFATDLAADRWMGLGAAVEAASVAFTPTGTVAATNVQTAIAEVSGDVTDVADDLATYIAEMGATLFGKSLIDDADADEALGTLGLTGSYAEITGNASLAANQFFIAPKTKVVTATATLSLPAANTVVGGLAIDVKSLTTGDVQLQPNGADEIDGVNANVRVPAYSTMRVASNGTDGWVIMIQSPFAIGETKVSASSVTPLGWLEEDGSEKSQTTYAGLYAVLGSTWNRGDEGAGNFRLPDSRERVEIGSGTGTAIERVTDANVSAGADTFLVPSNADKWVTGMPVTLTTTGVLPTASGGDLAPATTYWIVRASTTTVKLARTLVLAQNGTTIDLTGQGTGTHTITATGFSARTLGGQGGEKDHAMSITELLAHIHSGSISTANINSGDSGGSSVQTAGAMGSTGGNAAMNVMQPYIVKRRLIKT